MKTANTKKVLTAIFAVMILFNVAIPAFAADSTDLTKIWDGPALVPCGGSKTTSTAECDWTQLIVLANNVVKFLVYLAATLVVIAFCYAGFLYMTAFGEMSKIEQAHGIFKSAIVGLFFVICGWLIIATILKVLDVKDTVVDTVDFSSVTTVTGQSH